MLESLSRFYQRVLAKVLRIRWFVILFTIAMVVYGFMSIKSIPMEGSPSEDVGFIMTVYNAQITKVSTIFTAIEQDHQFDSQMIKR